ncbi:MULTISPECIES: tryptophan halogenase family protein [unclassified Shewanella]|uniref:tryptophan halogenase family protein n=1 Tax=unclassified Shewanella TaxID=196818 RepID=UPI000C82D005|nr:MULTISPECIES: tryptophan halogenase family protein [unclassified Shewanella]MDO6680241.1 tryptophan 7-halogenase [Shewanella sp. 4_MG-2023]PMG42872.1 tryptophan halogenase [Shewanella sp. 10N.286.52.B9]
MEQAINHIVIVGGGTAGWITAGILAAEHNADNGKLSPSPKLNITLIESPDVATIGVGEGTWPSMRTTLKKIGISETEFLISCDASFKQGSRFINWTHSLTENHSNNPNNSPSNSPSNKSSDHYLHPFSLPMGTNEIDLCPYWLPHRDQVSFADAVGQQNQLSQLFLAPKQITTAEYQFQNNYGYHLNAGKFSQLLQKHCTEKLGVSHIRDHVTAIHKKDNGDIGYLATKHSGEIAADLFVDCTGVKSLLLGEQLEVPFICQKAVLFNDSALAVQVPYPEPETDIASCTHSTAQTNGWIWDIGLPTRRGVGHVYSSSHTTQAEAEQQLIDYLKPTAGLDVDNLNIRALSIAPGHRQVCWKNNCMAIGMASGFIEPLEASALALVEWSANTLAQQLPANRQVMDIVSARVNKRFQQHWQQIIEFLKLHYVLSKRSDSDYWHDHRESSTIPDSLQEQLQLWQTQPPSRHDIQHTDVLFPAASFQFVLYGMGFETQMPNQLKPSLQNRAQQLFADNIKRTQGLKQVLPSNRELLNKIQQYGLSRI